MNNIILLKLITLLILPHGEGLKVSLKNNNWILRNQNESIEISNIKLPCGVYSDLEANNLTESVLFSYNDVELRWIAKQNWSYTTNFQVSKNDLNHKHLILTFHGLDTISEIVLNNVIIGNSDNMFVRYRFDVKNLLIEGENELKINFQSPIDAAKRLSQSKKHSIPPECPPKGYNGECYMNQLRKMQASFAWDWGLAAPSVGIWKDIELEIYDSLLIRDITFNLIDSNSNWHLNFEIFVESGMSKNLIDCVIIYELSSVAGPFNRNVKIFTDEYGEGDVLLNFTVPKKSIELWWPNGFGEQKLYNFGIKLEDIKINLINFNSKNFYGDQKTIKIGFRTIELVQEHMTNGLSFYFKINSIPIFMKGSNWIPSHILPEKSTENTESLLSEARDAKMNMLRVWGGGVYESDEFYQLADEFGILIWQDMMFACAMYPGDESFLDNVKVEVIQQIKRIQHHSSIALFATNNENEVALRQNWYGTQGNYDQFAEEYNSLYVSIITTQIKKIDNFRPILTSSPSNGAYSRDADKYNISLNPQNNHFGDVHFYPLNTNSWRPETFHQARFVSEYGFQGFPMGWEEVARIDDDIKELINHRQHHPLNNTLITFLIQENLNVNFNDLQWDDQVYLSQISQAIALKTETEVYRIGKGNFINTMGALYWQLNDVWIAPSWSSIEFNGNLKFVHHWIMECFDKVAIVAQVNILNKLMVYAISDEINSAPKVMKIVINVHKFTEFSPVDTLEVGKFDMQPNAVTAVETIDLYSYLNHRKLNVYEHFLLFYLYPYGNETSILATNFLFPGGFQNIKIVIDPNIRVIFLSKKCQNSISLIDFEVQIDSPAIFVWLFLQHDQVKKYKFSKNAFIQVKKFQKIKLSFKNPNCQWKVTKNDVKVKSLNKFMK